MKKFITFIWACTIALILAGMCEMSSFDNEIQKYSCVKNVKAETVKNQKKNQTIVLNAPTKTEFVQNLADDIDIPVVLTIVSLNEDLEKRMLHTKANIINVSGGKDTVKIVKKLREIDPNFPIIATGGPTEETVREVIQAGANAVTFTPPTNGEIFKGMMEEYRHRYD